MISTINKRIHEKCIFFLEKQSNNTIGKTSFSTNFYIDLTN